MDGGGARGAGAARDGARLTAAVRAVPSVPWQLPEGCACSHKGVPEPGKCEGPPRLVGHEAQMACAGVMATGDAFLVNPKVGLRLASEHGSVTVDMESAAVALEARNHGTRFAALRVIGDTVGPLGESLYYCLKPMSGQRLADALRAGVPALLDGPTPPGDVATCRAPAAPEAMTVEAVSAEQEAAPMGLRLR